jgi:hypothetical protein
MQWHTGSFQSALVWPRCRLKLWIFQLDDAPGCPPPLTVTGCSVIPSLLLLFLQKQISLKLLSFSGGYSALRSPIDERHVHGMCQLYMIFHPSMLITNGVTFVESVGNASRASQQHMVKASSMQVVIDPQCKFWVKHMHQSSGCVLRSYCKDSQCDSKRYHNNVFSGKRTFVWILEENSKTIKPEEDGNIFG